VTITKPLIEIGVKEMTLKAKTPQSQKIIYPVTITSQVKMILKVSLGTGITTIQSTWTPWITQGKRRGIENVLEYLRHNNSAKVNES